MPRGGARAVSGPPPDPNALRRERPSDAAGWTTLPREPEYQPPPEWPLIQATQREVEFWLDLWQRPQAIMWRQLDQTIEVAMFVRKLCEAEMPKASVELQKVVRQYLDSLGLSVQGMLRNRWRIEEADNSTPSAETKPTRPSAKNRMRVVKND
ncbi:hypothetical protein [Amycolatopsis orientalis]|uniref:phage terminase small subunit n=1 Tax=Amycolatopsis orientalis TaxID=31958 RepID=UPI0003A11C9C|nr:hypothetical protein [Amycolatopsis orientalis]